MEWLRRYTKVFYEHRYKLTYVVIAILIAAAFFYRLNNLTPGPHSDELLFFDQAVKTNLSNFVENIIFLPYTALMVLIHQFVDITQVSLRLPSIIFAVSMIPMLYYVLYIWHTRRIATLGVILLLSSSWFISLARFGTPNILYAWGILASITALTMIFHHSKHDTKRLVLMAAAGFLVGLSLYVPYTAYIYILTAAVGYRYIQRLVNELSELETVVFLSATLVIVSPLIAGLITEPGSALALLGIPDSFDSIASILENMKDIFSQVFWRANEVVATNVGNLPLLGIFGASLTALGMYHYEQHRHNLRTHIIVGAFFMMIFVLSLDYSTDKIAALLPLVYILIAMGALTLLTQWYKIFPSNPFARSVGLIVMALFVVMNITYHNQRFFSAWARAPETKLAFADDVVILENRLIDYIDSGVGNLTIYAESSTLKRLKTWFEHSGLDINIYAPDDANTQSSQLLLVEPGFKLDDTDVALENYELDLKTDTTSKLEPKTYQFYIEKITSNN